MAQAKRQQLALAQRNNPMFEKHEKYLEFSLKRSSRNF
jgi:hypothetical protein